MWWCTKIAKYKHDNNSSGSCQGMVTTLTLFYGNNILAHISVSTPTTILTTKCKHSETKFHVESCLTATGQYSNTTSDTSMELPILGKVRNSCAKIKQVYGQLGLIICQDFDVLHTLYFYRNLSQNLSLK